MHGIFYPLKPTIKLRYQYEKTDDFTITLCSGTLVAAKLMLTDQTVNADQTVNRSDCQHEFVWRSTILVVNKKYFVK
jgi:hypothetical protein